MGQDVELHLAEAPAVFVCLSCFLAPGSLRGSQWKFRFGENLPSSLMSSSERDAARFFQRSWQNVTLVFICRGKVKGISNRSRFERLPSLCLLLRLPSFCAVLCQLQLLRSLNNLVDEFLFHSLAALSPMFTVQRSFPCIF